MCLLPYQPVPRETQKIQLRENQLLLSTISPHKAVSSQVVSRWLVQGLALGGIDT